MTKPIHYRQSAFGGFFGTLLWLLPLALCFVGGGYALARFVLAPHYLQPSTVHFNRPQPIRVLSPEEAAAVARDEPSRVWTEGVDRSNLPKMDNAETPRRHWSSKSKPAATPVEKTKAPTDTAVPDNTPAPVDAPAIDDGNTAPPPAEPAPSTDTPAGDDASNQ